MKRLLSVLLVICISVSLFAGVTFAATIVKYSGTCGEDLRWELWYSGELFIYNYIWKNWENSFDNDSVIDEDPWASYAGLKASKMTEHPWDVYCSEIKEVIIEAGVSSIVENAFEGCTALKSVEIADSVTAIGDSAFSECSTLSSVNIPESVTSIGERAFADCISLTAIEIPNSVVSVGDWAFSHGYALTSVKIGDGVTSIGKGLFYRCQALTSITIPNGVMSIGEDAFTWCNSLTSVEIGDRVMSVGEYAFYDCDSLTDVYYGGSESTKNTMVIDEGNSCLLDAMWHYSSDPKVLLSTVNGAQIRTRGNQGLRFISTIDKTMADFAHVVEYGIILIPSADLTNISELQIGATLNGHTVAKVPAKKLYDVTDTTITFTAVITNIAEKNYEREYTARAYAIMDDGSVVYSDTGASRSIYAVAKKGLESTTETAENKAVFQEIVDTVEKGWTDIY